MVSDEIFPDSGGGGLGRGAWQESKHLAARGHAVELWCLDRGGGRPERETIEGLKVHRLDASRFYAGGWAFLDLLARSRRHLDESLAGFRPDVVVGQSPLSTWLALRSPRLAGVRLVYRYNSSWPEEHAIDRPGPAGWPGRAARAWVERRVVARADAVAAISRFMSANFAARYRRPAAALAAGVDFEAFSVGDKAQARAALGLAGSPLLLTVRNLRPRMGWEILLGAAERLRRDMPGLKVVVVGAGPLEASLRAEIAARGLDGVVSLAGRVADERLPLYYRAADLFAMPTSRLEGLGLALLEALACGTPCVGTRVGGIPEVLRPLDPGWVADAPTPEAFAEAARRALGARRGAEELRAHARARFGWDRMAEGLESLFERKPRLLHVVTRLDFGGSAENVLLSCEGARRGGFDAALASGPSATPAALPATVPLVELPSLRRELSIPRDLVAFLEIAALLRAWKPDILHTHASKAGFLGRWAARALRLFGAGPRLVVHTPHGHVFFGYFGPLRSALYEALERLSAGSADRLVALSEGEKRDHLERGIGRPEQWSVVPSGVDVAPREGPKADLGFPADSVVVGTVARLAPVKGVGVLLDAFARLAQPRARLLVVGGGELAGELRARSERLGIAHRVVFSGYQADPIPFLRAMHVYAQPSLNEGMGKALVQAQALGLPVAASRVCGIPDVVGDGETGLLVPPSDPRALADALSRLIADEGLRARLGQAGRRRVLGEGGEAPFSVGRMTRQLSALYRAALGALAACALALPASAAPLRVALHVHSDVSHRSFEALESIAGSAERLGIDVLIPTDTFAAEWEYGLWPLRGLIRKRVAEGSVLSYGLEDYMDRVKALRRDHPRLTVIPGVEVAPYYRWEGLPWRRLTIHDANRHLLVFGPEGARAYARLPAAANRASRRFDALLLWPLVPLGVGAAGWLSTRRRRFAALALLGLVFSADAFPFRRAEAGAYAQATPWVPYQALIDAARAAGALVVWAHPDSPSWNAAGAASSRVGVLTEPYPEALVRTSGYDGFAVLKEGLRGAGRPGGSWDAALTLFVSGQRPRPPWALAELDYRAGHQTRLDAALMVVDAASRQPSDVLAALSRGRFYSVQAGSRALELKSYLLVSKKGAAGSGETLMGAREPRLELELANADGTKSEGEVEVIRGGEIVAKQSVSIPGRWTFELINDAPRCYYRVVARSEANNILVTNPIFAFER